MHKNERKMHKAYGFLNMEGEQEINKLRKKIKAFFKPNFSLATIFNFKGLFKLK